MQKSNQSALRLLPYLTLFVHGTVAGVVCFTLSSYLYLIIADMPIAWFLNEVRKSDKTSS